jgi:hypothetical protein
VVLEWDEIKDLGDDAGFEKSDNNLTKFTEIIEIFA